MQICFYRTKIIFIEFCYISATILMYHFVLGRHVGCFLPTSFVSCTELMPIKQANNFRVQSKLRTYPSHFCRENYHSAPAGKGFSRLTLQSTSLFSQGFVGTRVHCDNRHNQRRHNEVHAFLRALVLKGKIHLMQ